MNKTELKAALNEQRPRITSLYGEGQAERQIARYGQLIDDYERAFGNTDCALFSAPGRTEVGGNHTDHQHGRVLAASVNMDAAAAAGRREGEVVFYSSGRKKHLGSTDPRRAGRICPARLQDRRISGRFQQHGAERLGNFFLRCF